ncbi:MAG TPA: AmmeMemoRadiSam system protein B [Rhodospirillaceae bacterium]|nr:AmmeMemoRadiSam system protein B [Rhodospirillaceae bacterium]
MGFVRNAAVAGMFYPAEPNVLAADLRRLLEAVPPSEAVPPKAVIAPHAGYIYSGSVAASVYAPLSARRRDISRVVLLGPAHRLAFGGIAASSAEAFATPLGRVALDQEAIASLQGMPDFGILDAAHKAEHSLEVHLPFLQMTLDRFRLIPLLTGAVSVESVAHLLGRLWGGSETLIVISSDLSHYLDYARAQSLDSQTRLAIEQGDEEAIGPEQACGRVPILGLLRLAKQLGLAARTVDVRNSGDTAGPKDRVVGYGAWAFASVPAKDEELRRQGPSLIALARQAIEDRLAGVARPVLPDAQSFGAAFVTLHRQGQLRGCIGSVTAWRPLRVDVADNALKAAFEDPRFPPVTAAELSDLEISVSVLTPPEPLTFTDEADLLRKLRPRIDGLIIEEGARRALFLPAVWEQLPNPEDFLGHLKQKAGMPARPLSANCRASIFRAVELKVTPK